MIGRNAKKKKKKREENKKLYNEHRGALELLDKHGDSLAMMGNNLELMRFAAILIDPNSPSMVEYIHLSEKGNDGSKGVAVIRLGDVSITLDYDSFVTACAREMKRHEEKNKADTLNSP